MSIEPNIITNNLQKTQTQSRSTKKRKFLVFT